MIYNFLLNFILAFILTGFSGFENISQVFFYFNIYFTTRTITLSKKAIKSLRVSFYLPFTFCTC